MESQNDFPHIDEARADAQARAHCAELLDGLERTLRTARTLVDASRAVDLAGLDSSVGIACAKVLDLPPELGRELRGKLMALREQLDALDVAMRLQAG